jgi:hypothetical protein
MRTPNTECIICSKPLYRRPNELEKIRYVACGEHRLEAARMFPITDSQKESLILGRRKGTNNLTGIPKSDTQKERVRIKMTENHYKWTGGTSRLNISIRQMVENRKWIKAVKDRDGACTRCGSTFELEADHIKELSIMIVEYGIRNRADARKCAALWDVSNCRTLCKKCHCEKDGRKYVKNGNGRRKQKT